MEIVNLKREPSSLEYSFCESTAFQMGEQDTKQDSQVEFWASHLQFWGGSIHFLDCLMAYSVTIQMVSIDVIMMGFMS